MEGKHHKRLAGALLFAFCALAAVPAMAQFAVDASFRAWRQTLWSASGTDNSGSNDSGIFTGGRGALDDGKGTNDRSGQGWLRLTTSLSSQRGNALYHGSVFPSSSGVQLEFDHVSWGGDGADGLSVFLFDASQDMSGANNGAGLGYCQGSGGYLGVGLDEFGNFSNSPRQGLPSAGCIDGSGPGRTPQKIVIRGPAEHDNRYVAASSPGGYARIDAPGATARPGDIRHLRLVLVPKGNDSGYRIWGYYGGVGQSPQTIFEGVDFPYPAPPRLSVGFGASTGVRGNIHEVRNLHARAPANIVVTQTASTPLAFHGDEVGFSITVTNADINPVDPGIQASYIEYPDAPLMLGPMAAQLSNVHWLCTATPGSRCPLPSGQGDIDADNYELAPGGVLSYKVTGSIAAQAACGKMSAGFSAEFGEDSDFVDAMPEDNRASAQLRIACPTLSVRAISQGGSGQFSFTGDNGIATQQLVTDAEGVAVSGVASALASAMATHITASVLPFGFILADASCSGINSAGTVTLDRGSRTLTLDATATRTEGAIVCTFIHDSRLAALSISTSNNAGVVVSGKVQRYDIHVANAGPQAADGAVVRAPLPTAMRCDPGQQVRCQGEGGAQCAAPFTAGQLQSEAGVPIPVFPPHSAVSMSMSCLIE